MNKAVVALMAVALTLGFATTAAAEETDDATIAGGDVQVNDLVEEADSEEWAGFYGNLEVATTLADGEDTLLDWTVEDQTGSAVYAVERDTESTLDLDSLGEITEGQEDDLNGVPTGNEAPSELYTEENSYESSSIDIGPTASLTTEGNFQNFLLSTDDVDPAQGDAVFTSEVKNDETGFNDEESQHDYEVLVGSDNFQNDEDWDFYVEIA